VIHPDSASGSSSEPAGGVSLHTWELNEAPHTIRTNATFRTEFLVVLESLARGCQGLPNASSSSSSSVSSRDSYLNQYLPGVLFFAGMGQRTRYLGGYKEELKRFLSDEGFWSTSEKSVAVYSFETYTDPSSVCDASISVEQQVCLIAGYASHVWRLAAAGGNVSRKALEVLSGASTFAPFRYLRTLGSVFGCDTCGYGSTNITMEQFTDFLVLQGEAARSSLTAAVCLESNPRSLSMPRSQVSIVEELRDVSLSQGQGGVASILPPVGTGQCSMAFGFGDYDRIEPSAIHLSAALANVSLTTPSKRPSLAKCSVPNATPNWKWITSFSDWN
jgi:hypothetical protein